MTVREGVALALKAPEPHVFHDLRAASILRDVNRVLTEVWERLRGTPDYWWLDGVEYGP